MPTESWHRVALKKVGELQPRPKEPGKQSPGPSVLGGEEAEALPAEQMEGTKAQAGPE